MRRVEMIAPSTPRPLTLTYKSHTEYQLTLFRIETRPNKWMHCKLPHDPPSTPSHAPCCHPLCRCCVGTGRRTSSTKCRICRTRILPRGPGVCLALDIARPRGTLHSPQNRSPKTSTKTPHTACSRSILPLRTFSLRSRCSRFLLRSR